MGDERTLLQGGAQSLELFVSADGIDFDGTVAAVAHEAVNANFASYMFDEVAKPDALDTSGNGVTPR